MIGLWVLGLMGLWIWIAFRIARWIGRRMAHGVWQSALTFVLFTLLLPLPVLDELLARPKIEALCAQNAVLRIDEERIRGRLVKYSAEPSNENLAGVGLRTSYTRSVLRDAQTGEALGTEGWYRFYGGLFIRTIGTAEMNNPMFARTSCAPLEGLEAVAKRLGFEIEKELRNSNAKN